MASHAVGEAEVDGHPVRVLASLDEAIEARFAPGVGMIGCSLTHRGEELLGQRGGLARYATTGSSMGIPILHPWANRLAGLAYTAGGRAVVLDPQASGVRCDPNGLPIHGLLAASPHWAVEGADADATRARLVARFDFAARPELLASFPFPHELLLDVSLAGRVLSVSTVLSATGDVPVPVSFGFHPYLRLPGVPCAAWWVELPVRRRLVLDARQLPTGTTAAVEVLTGPLGDRTFDDAYDELAPLPTFVLAGGGRRLEVAFVEGFPCAQVFAPAGQDFICFEPMTAPPNALVAGGPALALVPPGGYHRAVFTLTIADAAG